MGNRITKMQSQLEGGTAMNGAYGSSDSSESLMMKDMVSWRIAVSLSLAIWGVSADAESSAAITFSCASLNGETNTGYSAAARAATARARKPASYGNENGVPYPPKSSISWGFSKITPNLGPSQLRFTDGATSITTAEHYEPILPNCPPVLVDELTP
jgi:hypothetical protein